MAWSSSIARHPGQSGLKDIGGYIREGRLRGHPEKGRGWEGLPGWLAGWLAHVRTAVRHEERISTAMKSLGPLIREAVSALHIEAGAGQHILARSPWGGG